MADVNSKEVYWECDKDAIKEFMSEFIDISKYTDFKFKYNWVYYPEIEDYIKRLMYTSYARSKEIREKLPELINDVEEFFAQAIKLGYINKGNIGQILNKLKDKNNGFRCIKVLPEKGLYGRSVDDVIEINTNMTRHPNSPKLTPKEITMLYMFHEMGHKIINLSKSVTIDTYIATVEQMLRNKGVNTPDVDFKEVIPNGFLMMEEALVQELAEQLTYSATNKIRPEYRLRNEIASIQPHGFETCDVQTNLDFYGLFQEPTINFGKTLRGCYTLDSSRTDILSNMIAKAINTNFVDEVIKEYNHGDGKLYQDLFQTLRAMGFIQMQKYASFGQGKPVKGIIVSNCLKAVENITTRNQDMRPYPFGGFPKVDFSSCIIPEPQLTV